MAFLFTEDHTVRLIANLCLMIILRVDVQQFKWGKRNEGSQEQFISFNVRNHQEKSRTRRCVNVYPLIFRSIASVWFGLNKKELSTKRGEVSKKTLAWVTILHLACVWKLNFLGLPGPATCQSVLGCEFQVSLDAMPWFIYCVWEQVNMKSIVNIFLEVCKGQKSLYKHSSARSKWCYY